VVAAVAVEEGEAVLVVAVEATVVMAAEAIAVVAEVATDSREVDLETIEYELVGKDNIWVKVEIPKKM
jgi:hypothetical protein